MLVVLDKVKSEDLPDVDRSVVKQFTRKLTRWGPLGARLLQLLDDANPITRLECAHVAAASGYPLIARKLAHWPDVKEKK